MAVAQLSQKNILMKKYLVALLLLPFAASAADESSLAFTEKKIELPSLSLVPKSPPPLPTFLNDTATWFRSQSVHTLAPKKFVSHMPIVSPKAEVDSKMLIKIPDSSTDYKLTVVAPNVEPAK